MIATATDVKTAVMIHAIYRRLSVKLWYMYLHCRRARDTLVLRWPIDKTSN